MRDISPTERNARRALRSLILQVPAEVAQSVTGAVLALTGLLKAERKAWREYAEHLEWCMCCAEDGVPACEVGRSLRNQARACAAETAPVTT